MTFQKFFKAATGNAPYDYQCRLACGPAAKADSLAPLATGRSCESQLISIPTGLGKTAAVVLAWLWNRVIQSSQISKPACGMSDAGTQWPRRLVYCLPMRTLVEQTEAEVKKWIAELLKNADELGLSVAARADLRWLAEHSPVILMGGEELDSARGDWDIHPERPAILIGTQDMLLSRALNRGYGMSRARWPMHFGLLNNDALWVMDEVQLMDVALATSAQLQAFRSAAGLTRPCLTWWMSATLRIEWLETADTKELVASLRDSVSEIPAQERTGGLWSVTKTCELIAVKNPKDWARKIWDTHKASTAGEHGRITLVVANTVETAIQVHAELAALSKKAKNSSIELRLVHSRFRGIERASWREAFLNRSACTPAADRIVVATQIVEAGVDISATSLFTELAPWACLVQRFGRAARYGGTANIFVVDRDITEKSALPYTVEELEAAKAVLAPAQPLLQDASLTGLVTFQEAHTELLPKLFPYEQLHLLLRRELDELFDTSPDLSGADLDISRFIRSGEERDVLVFWRDVPPRTRPEESIRALRHELCPVPVGKARAWLQAGAKKHAWVWDYLDASWRPCGNDDVFPGQTILVAQNVGGYAPATGWTGAPADHEFAVETNDLAAPAPHAADDSAAADTASQYTWQTIAVHGQSVANELSKIAAEVNLPPAERQLLALSGRWHDVGKAHPAFQASIKRDAAGHPGTDDLAKAPQYAWHSPSAFYTLPGGERRSGFRHELASALALFGVLVRHRPAHPALLGGHEELLELLGAKTATPTTTDAATPPEEEVLALNQPSFDLFAYMVCSHHGKVRGAWHTTPADQEFRDFDARGLPIHGVRNGDLLPPVAINTADGRSYLVPALSLSLEPARLGFSPHTGASWAERTGRLLTTHGLFHLGYLEALMRAADARASRAE
jgi:CRISPR-associated endonuclease/helicase Cas3